MSQLGVVWDRPDANLLWGGLLGYSGDPVAARSIHRDDPALAVALRRSFAQFDGLRDDHKPNIIDYGAVRGDHNAIRAAVDLLGDLPDRERAEVLISVLTNEASPSESVTTAVRALERRAERSIGEILEPLVSSAPVEDRPPVARPRPIAAVGVGFAALGSLIVLSWAWSQPRVDPESAVPPTTTSAPSTTEPSIDIEALVADPARQLDIELADDGLVNRRDPRSGELIWRAGPYPDATAIRLDSNTVTVDRGWRGRIYISLLDGTLLPP